MIIDPGKLYMFRRFDWKWLFLASTFILWWVIIGNQVFQHVLNELKFRRNRIELGDMKVIIKADPEVKKNFQEFARKQYITESLNFMEDFDTY